MNEIIYIKYDAKKDKCISNNEQVCPKDIFDNLIEKWNIYCPLLPNKDNIDITIYNDKELVIIEKTNLKTGEGIRQIYNKGELSE